MVVPELDTPGHAPAKFADKSVESKYGKIV